MKPSRKRKTEKNVSVWSTAVGTVGILVLAALVTPPDVVTQLILFTAVYGLYEISIQLVKRVERKRVRQLREEGILGEDEDLYSEFDDDEDEGEKDAKA